MTRLAVLWDEGAVNAADIAIGLGGLGEVSFVCAPASRPLMPLLAELGEVIELAAGLDEVTRQLADGQTQAVLTFSDAVLVEAAELAARLGLPFNSVETVSMLTDKGRQRAQLRSAGLDPVRTSTLHSAADWPAALTEVGLPAVLKPIRGSGSRDTFLIRDEQRGAALAGKLLPDRPVSDEPAAGDAAGFILEQFLVGRPCLPYGDYVSVESVVSGADIQHLAVTGKFPMQPPFREIGHFWPSVLAEAECEQVKQLTGRALAALGVSLGITHTELKLTPDGPRIIEVNGRLGGYLNDLGRAAYGIDLVEIAGRLALGQSPPRLPQRPGQVHFQYSSPMPTTACTLRRIEGVPALRRAPGITGYRPFYPPGSQVGPSVMTRRLDMVFGVAADHREMLQILKVALAELRYQFSVPTGDCELTPADLIELAGQQSFD